MATADFWAGTTSRKKALPKRLSLVRRQKRQLQKWLEEFVSVVRLLWALTRSFRKQMLVIFLLQLVIVIWETLQPLIVAMGVDTFEARVPYLQMVAIIVYPYLILKMPHSIALPVIRDLYITKYFKYQFDNFLCDLTINRVREKGPSDDPSVKDKGGPIAQSGRDMIYQIVDSLLRDPLYALRGVGVLGYFCYKGPWLTVLLASQIVVDLFVTLIMDEKLRKPFKKQVLVNMAANGMENRLMETQQTQEEAYKQYAMLRALRVKVSSRAEVSKMIFQRVIRIVLSDGFHVGSLVLIAWWVHTGYAKIGDYLLFSQIADKANDPLAVFYGWQGRMMTAGKLIYDYLEKLCGLMEKPEVVNRAT